MFERRTKIVTTLGPATESEEKLEAIVRAGAQVLRLNFSHGTHESHVEMIEKIRSLEKKLGWPLTIMQDLQGPKVRTGELPEDGVELVEGAELVLKAKTVIS